MPRATSDFFSAAYYLALIFRGRPSSGHSQPKRAVHHFHPYQRGAAMTARRIVNTYDYTDEAGRLIYQGVRYQPKDFRPRRPDGRGGWHHNLAGVRRVPYRLADLTKAPKERVV
jgi:hypothetical protein